MNQQADEQKITIVKRTKPDTRTPEQVFDDILSNLLNFDFNLIMVTTETALMKRPMTDEEYKKFDSCLDNLKHTCDVVKRLTKELS